MTPELSSRAALPSAGLPSAGLPANAEARAMIVRARRLRAESLARLARTAWSRIAGRSARALEDARQGAMPHAHA